MKQKTQIKARVWLEGRDEPIIADVINPGSWFGKCHLVQVAIANNLNPFFVIEARSPDEAIITWADDEKYGHHINDDEKQEERENWLLNHSEEEEEPEWTTAGNDGHCVNLDNVAFCKFKQIEYYVDLDKENWTLVSAVQSEIEEDNEDS
jgi:hypothetical protein